MDDFSGTVGIRKSVCKEAGSVSGTVGPFIVGRGVIILIVITVFSFRVQLRTSHKC